MRTTLTIRTDEALRRALEERARAQGKTVSAFAREVLASAVAERPLEARVGHVRGRLRLDSPAAGTWRDRLRRYNWRE